MQSGRLFVGNLSYSVTNSDLEELFSQHGEVVDVKVIDNKGFGFVEMSSPAEAEKAKEELNDTDLKGRTLRIDEASPRKNRESRDFRR